MSAGEDQLAQHLNIYKIPFVREFRFDPNRRWRFDFLVGDTLAVEVEGGTWTNGRHSRGSGMAADCEKYNRATILGYRLLRFTTDQVQSGVAIDTVMEALK